MKISHVIATGLALAYGAQVCGALYCHVKPMESRVHGSERYVIRYGYPLPWSLIPLFGALGFGEGGAVGLTVYDERGAEKSWRSFEMQIDVQETYPAVWPEKQWKR